MLKFYSVQSLNRISKTKEIWCWGCGKKFNELLQLYQNEPFISHISALIDGNSCLWEMKKDIGGKVLPISSYDNIKHLQTNKVMFLLTTDRYQEVYTFLSEKLGPNNLLCCKYPEIYFTYSRVIQFLLSFFPKRRQILFHAGKEPHENANALVDYLTNEYQGRRYKLIFLQEKNRQEKQNFTNIITLNKNTLSCRNSFRENLRYCWLYSVSKFLMYENEPLKKVHRSQILIYLNHGTIPLKDVHDVLKQPDEVDFTICPSKGCAQIYSQQYHLPIEKHLYMMPPRIEYIKNSRFQLEKIMDTGGRQVIIWLPTFRTLAGTDRKDSNITSSIPLIANDEYFEIINRQLCLNNQLLLIKNHPKEKEGFNIPVGCKNIVRLTDEELSMAGLNLHEILGDTVALLTDYSGISFEYLLLKKPIGYVISDIHDYSRGFAYDNPMDYMPGKRIRSIRELVEFLNDIKEGNDEFKSSRDALMNQLYQGNENRNGSQELIQFLDHLRGVIT